MNGFMIFSDRDKQACELRVLAQHLSLLGDIIQVENGRIDNNDYLRADEKIKELISTASPLLSEITNILVDKK